MPWFGRLLSLAAEAAADLVASCAGGRGRPPAGQGRALCPCPWPRSHGWGLPQQGRQPGRGAQELKRALPHPKQAGAGPKYPKALAHPQPSFNLAPRAIFLCSGVPWLGLRIRCATLQVSAVVVEWMGGLSRWRVSSVLLDVRCSFAEVKDYQSGWATSVRC